MTRDEVLSKLRELKPGLEQAYGVTRLRLFGSHARGEARPDSDIDLIVDLGRPLGLDFFGLEIELAERLGRKVDLATPGGLHRIIRDRVLTEAVDV
ncbi:MAG: nucleotidyltransferase family protein [Terricaulis sp.]